MTHIFITEHRKCRDWSRKVCNDQKIVPKSGEWCCADELHNCCKGSLYDQMEEAFGNSLSSLVTTPQSDHNSNSSGLSIVSFG